MRLWAEIFDASDNRLGAGPITSVLNCTLSRRLDGAGEFAFSFPATDRRALNLATNERRARVYVEHADERPRLLAHGIIRDVSTSIQDSGQIIDVRGPDIMNELARRSTLLGRTFENTALATIASTLIALASGWTVTVDAGLGNLDARFEGSSVLKAFVRLAEEQGLHIRLGLGDKELEYGAFGADSGVTILHANSALDAFDGRDDVLLIDSLTVQNDSNAVVNWIIPLGAGEGKAALTLAESTRTTPFTIQTQVGPDGDTLYYISDAASVASFGEIQKIVLFKQIGPISNNDNARIRASNALYDAAAAWLQRNAGLQNTYTTTEIKVRTTVRPGDKVRLVYDGDVLGEDGEVVRPVSIDGDFWVLKATEQVNESGDTLKLKLSDIDRHAMSEAEIVVGAMEAIEARNVHLQTFPAIWENTWVDGIRSENVGGSLSRDAVFKLAPANFIAEIIKVEIDFKSLFIWSPTQVDGSFTSYFFNFFEFDHYIENVSILINGVDESSALGGPWNDSDLNEQIDEKNHDITQILRDAPGGIFQEHTIAFHATEPGALIDKTIIGTTTNVRNTEGFMQLTVRALVMVQAITPS